MGTQDVARNINLLRSQLNPLLSDIVTSVLAEDQQSDINKQSHASPRKLKSSHSKDAKEVLEYDRDQQRKMVNYAQKKMAADNYFWQKMIEKINSQFEGNKNRDSSMDNELGQNRLLYEDVRNSNTLDIVKYFHSLSNLMSIYLMITSRVG